MSCSVQGITFKKPVHGLLSLCAVYYTIESVISWLCAILPNLMIQIESICVKVCLSVTKPAQPL